MLHSNNLTPAPRDLDAGRDFGVRGCVAVVMVFGDGSAPTDASIKALPQGIWSSFGYTTTMGWRRCRIHC